MPTAPKTREDWELYNNKGSAQAAQALNKMLTLVGKEMVSSIPKRVTSPWGSLALVKVAYQAATEKAYVTMEQYSSFGAMDTEPLGVLHDALISKLAKRFKLDEQDRQVLWQRL